METKVIDAAAEKRFKKNRIQERKYQNYFDD